MNPNMLDTSNSRFGQPMAQVCYSSSAPTAGYSHIQIYYDVLGKNGTFGFMIVLSITQFLICLSLVRP